MGNYISKNHRIGTAQRLAEGVGEDWYGFIASPEGTDAVTGTDEVSLDKLSRQILSHAKINNDGFALMANYTPNDDSGFVALSTLYYYGEKDGTPDEDNGNDVVVDYNQVDIRVYKILYRGVITGDAGTHIKISEFGTDAINSITDDFDVYSYNSTKEIYEPTGGTINIIYKYIGRINSDVLGNFYLREENIFPVRFDLINSANNSNPGGVEWITATGTIPFSTSKSTASGSNWTAIISGDGVSGKAEVTLDGSGYIESIKVVDAGKYFKDATKLKLLYPDNSEVATTGIKFGKISPVEGHGISHTNDEFEIARQFSFVGLKFMRNLMLVK